MKLVGIIVGVLCLFSVTAQNVQLKGRVIDESEETVVSATVRCLTKDSVLVNGNVSDGKGYFSLSVPQSKEAYMLIVSFIGYKDNISQVQGYGKDMQLGDIMLIPDTKQLDEVVVTG